MNRTAKSSINLAFMIVAFGCLAARTAIPQESEYVPGPVVDLHIWLGEECSFVPDLDVGECCAVHDIAYQAGGNWFDRLIADLEFRSCIREKNRPIVAEIYFWGVRTFGWLFFNYS